LARERGWEGTVEVAIDGNALLPVPQVVIMRSSGRTILDEQALEMMTQAAQATTLPDGLRGRDFRILLPVKYSLDADQ
jgi:TonB family protein